jgi:hypothetical protein
MILSAVATVAGLCFFFQGFHLLARKRLLLSARASEIRSAALGPVEVNGVAGGPYTTTAPITGRPCFLYHTTVWQQHEGRKQQWEKVADEILHLPFFIEDPTGQLLIAPHGADLDLHSDFREEYGTALLSSNFLSLQQVDVPSRVHAFLSRHGIVPARRLRIEERLIEPNDALFVAGTLAENPGIHVVPLAPRSDLPDVDLPDKDFPREDFPRDLSPSETSPIEPAPSAGSMPFPALQVIRLSSGAAPTATRDMSQQAKIAAALHRAGIAKSGTWSTTAMPDESVTVAKYASTAPVAAYGEERLRETRSREIRSSETRSNHARPNEARPPEVEPVRADYNLAPPEVLMKGTNHPTFAISFRSQKEFAGPLAWKSAVMVWGGAAMTLLGLYLLWAQMEAL